MPRIRTTIVILAVLALGGATVALVGSGGTERATAGGHADHGGHADRASKARQGAGGRLASAALTDTTGAKVGRVWMERRRGGLIYVYARLRKLLPADSFHGFHIHTVGVCDATTTPPFTSAGAHYELPTVDTNHPSHAGDLPSVLVNADGKATLTAVTDRFRLADLRDADGSAVMVHAGPDNFANTPTRYVPGPDQATLDTGDSGGRLACGVLR